MSEGSARNEEAIFDAAIQIKDLAERQDYVKRVCGGNPQLLTDIQSLLGHHDSHSFLDSLFLKPNFDLDEFPLTEGRGNLIGRYTLLEKIGEGGMAVVYMAVQEKPIRRKVALKIIKLGMDTGQVIARFEAERQALAMMDHPNIAKVFDAGATETGRPYFVMELVKGVSITEYCDQNNLGTHERLDLFVQVCSAVQHAHQKGIIHRDIKPSNIMAETQDGTPVPKVIDFGIAKAVNQRLTEKTLFTRHAQIIGTPAYMSPEQAESNDLAVDTRTDIYSLGVLLYELLTGTQPFAEEELRKAGYLEMQRIICRQEPAKPSTKLTALGEELDEIARHRGSSPTVLAKEIRGDLDWIVMKSLEKDRARRYSTTQELAADIIRHLRHEAVWAAAPGVSYRLGKFVRRHRLGVLIGLLTGVLLLLAVVTLAVSSVLIYREQGRTQQALQREQQSLRLETQARMKADQALAQEADARAQAERARTEAERQARIAQAVTGFLNRDLLAAATPERARGRQVTVREVLDAASQHIEGQFEDEPLIETAIRQTLGSTYRSLGHYPEAETHLARAFDILRQQFGEEDDRTLTLMSDLAELYRLEGHYDQAESLGQRLLELAPRVLGKEHPHTLIFMNNLALVYHQQGRYELAEQLHLQTLEIRRRRLGEGHSHTLNSLSNLASLYQVQGRNQQAEAIHLEILEIEKRALGKDHPRTFRTVSNLAASYLAQGRYADAESLLVESLPLQRAVLGPEHPSLVSALNTLAHVYRSQDRLEEAEPLYEEVVRLNTQTLGEEHPNTLASVNNLAELYRAQERCDEAMPLQLKTLEIKERVLGQEHPDTLASMNNLAELYRMTGQIEKSEQLHLRTLQASRRTLGEDHPNTLSTMNNLAQLYVLQGRYEEAETLHLRTLEIRDRVLNADHPYIQRSVRHLIELYEAWGKPEEARKWWSRLYDDEPPGPEPDESSAAATLAGPDTKRQLAPSAWKASWSPDGTRLVCAKASATGGLQIIDLANGQATDLAGSGKDPVWSPDGRFIAYVLGDNTAEEVWLTTPAGETPRKLVDGGYPTWSGEGTCLYVHSRKDNQILAVEVDDPNAEPRVFFDKVQPWYPAVSPDGERIAVSRPDALLIVARQTRKILMVWPAPGHRGLLPAWSPDGRKVAFGGFESEPFGVWILDVDDKRAIQVTSGPYTMPVWSYDGTQLAFDLRSDDRREIWAVETDTIQGPKLTAGQAARLGWSPTQAAADPNEPKAQPQ